MNNKKKIVSPKIEFNTLSDIYTMFVLVAGIPEQTFWNTDIRFLELVYIDKMAWDSYKNNPRER